MKKRLIPSFDQVDLSTLEDFYMAMARAIETSLLESGAEAGTDYTLLDLYNLAQPFVVEQFKTEKSLSFTLRGIGV